MQTALLEAATHYMNVLRDTAILDLQRRNVQVLQEQLKQTRDRFNVGEVTRTDVAQSESRVAAVAVAGAFRRSEPQDLASSLPPRHRRGAGRSAPRDAGRSPLAAIARSLDRAGHCRHPTVAAAQYTVDTAQYTVKAAEGSLYPTVTAEASVQKRWDLAPGSFDQTQATVLGRVSVPVYQGGSEYSLIRQAKETLGQRRIELDVSRDQVRASVVQGWATLQATKAQIIAAQAQVTASEVALNGVREEARVGQRTTLDVLNAQQELVTARVSLVTAQRDRVVASFNLLAAVGRLGPQVLSLKTEDYDPRVHYHQVRDKWFGVRNPDGR